MGDAGDVNEFLLYERECRRLAAQTKIFWIKKEFLSLAAYWKRLAESFDGEFRKSTTITRH